MGIARSLTGREWDCYWGRVEIVAEVSASFAGSDRWPESRGEYV